MNVEMTYWLFTRFVIDINLQGQFVVERPSPQYGNILLGLFPCVFVNKKLFKVMSGFNLDTDLNGSMFLCIMFVCQHHKSPKQMHEFMLEAIKFLLTTTTCTFQWCTGNIMNSKWISSHVQTIDFQ